MDGHSKREVLEIRYLISLQASPTAFITQMSLRAQASPNIGPSKYKPLKKGL